MLTDVSGKEVGAALVTALLQGTFSTISLEQPRASVFAHVNRFICAHEEINRYATLYFGMSDAAGRLEFINAGHPPPLIIHEGSVRQADLAECLPVGLLPEAEFTTAHATLSPGDTLVVYSDGVTEAETPSGEPFGVSQLLNVVAHNASNGVKELQAAIVAAVREFTTGADQADDITLLVIRYEG